MLLLCAKVVQTLIWINVLAILTEIAFKFCDYWLYLHHVVSSELESNDLIPPRNKFFFSTSVIPSRDFCRTSSSESIIEAESIIWSFWSPQLKELWYICGQKWNYFVGRILWWFYGAYTNAIENRFHNNWFVFKF